MERGKILFRLRDSFLLFAKAGLDIERLTTGGFQRDSDLPGEFFARLPKETKPRERKTPDSTRGEGDKL